MKLKRLLGALIALTLLGAGCASADALKQQAEDAARSAAEKVAEGAAKGAIKAKTGQDVNVQVTDHGLSFTDTSSGASFVAGENVTLPASFPKDVPIYPNGTLTSVQVVKPGESASLLFSTTDERTTIRDWYLKQADAAGWKIDGTIETADDIISSFSNVEGNAQVKLTVTIQPKGLDGKVTVLVARKGV